jgi:CPA2 family monovalent cation:H+ antiporter-2
MMIDPKIMVQLWVAIVVITIASSSARSSPAASAPSSPGMISTSLRVGMGLSQIGEFSFIIAQLGLTLKVTSDRLYPIAVTVSAITTLLTPYLIQASDPLVGCSNDDSRGGLVAFLDSYGQWLRGLNDGTRGDRTCAKLLRNGTFQIATEHRAGQRPVHRATWLSRTAEAHFRTARNTSRAADHRLADRDADRPPAAGCHFRKVRAAAMVIAEASIPRSAGGGQTKVLRGGDVQHDPARVSTALVLWMLLLASPVLPPWRAVVLLGIVIVMFSIVTWNRLVRVYARAQIAPPGDAHAEHAHKPRRPPRPPRAAPLPPMLKDALLETIPLPPIPPPRENSFASSSSARRRCQHRRHRTQRRKRYQPGPDDDYWPATAFCSWARNPSLPPPAPPWPAMASPCRCEFFVRFFAAGGI